MTFKKAGLVLVWIDRRVLCLHSTARYQANLLCKHPLLSRGKKNNVFHQPQDSQDWRTWDLVTWLVYIKKGRLCHSHNPMTLHTHRTDTTPILVTSRHLIFHHKEAARAWPALSTSTNLDLNPTASPDHRPAKPGCCQRDGQSTRTPLGHLAGWWDLASIRLCWSCWKSNPYKAPLMVFNERQFENANQYATIPTNNTHCHTSSQKCN